MKYSSARAFRLHHRQRADTLGVVDLEGMARSVRVRQHDGEDAPEYQGWLCERLPISKIGGSAAVWSRDSSHLGDIYDKYVVVLFIHKGSMLIQQAGKSSRVEAGSMATLLPRSEFVIESNQDNDVSVVYVPIKYLAQHGVAIASLAADAWPAEPLIHAVQALVDSSYELVENVPIGGSGGKYLHVEQALLELAVGMIGSHQNSQRSSEDLGAEEARARVAVLIEEKYADSRYGVDAIAEDLGASRRYVYTLFEGQDSSPASLLRMRRIDAAEALMRAAGPDVTLAWIARNAGFAGRETMAAVFKETRGVSPSIYRRGILTNLGA